ncbi:hypothetical protein P8935_12825 [Telmatobacter sp. DSM 110680]|uniref:TrbI/VirB10 family protein n=1 Tax=Telmatobacter sp. DSM 110680 TaxID=3036704 RepID=A0AAU7DDW9_9BACT
MNRPILACALFALATTALMAQDASQSSPYQGTSNPPPDDSIITTEQQVPIPKPPAGHPMQSAPVMQPAPQQMTVRQNAAPTPQTYGDGTDEGIVGVAPSDPTLSKRATAVDPDSDIVHPAPLPPGMLGEGTMIRVRLLDEVSSSFSEPGQPFRSRVASDVMQDGQIVIPAGAEIDGKVAQVSTGHFGGHGSILLQPETVTLANGSTFHLHAMVRSTPGSHLRVGSEGVITPGSRLKKDGLEYAGVGGGGMVVGAILGGPVGMLAGGLVGAGLVTTHNLVSHPQANIDAGAYLMLTLTDQVQLVPAGSQGN